jgi:hypothetical protein
MAVSTAAPTQSPPPPAITTVMLPLPLGAWTVDRPWGPQNLPYNGYRVSFPWVKRPGRGVNYPSPFSAEIKQRLELYLYYPSVAFMDGSRASFTFTSIFYGASVAMSCIPGDHPTSKSKVPRSSLPGGKAVGSWSCPLASIQCQDYEWVEVYLYVSYALMTWTWTVLLLPFLFFFSRSQLHIRDTIGEAFPIFHHLFPYIYPVPGFLQRFRFLPKITEIPLCCSCEFNDWMLSDRTVPKRKAKRFVVPKLRAVLSFPFVLVIARSIRISFEYANNVLQDLN